MKQFLFIQAILICVAIPSFAQKKVEKYCVIIPSFRSGNYNKVQFELYHGKVDSLFSFKDSSFQVNLTNAIPTLKTIPDLLNYMGSQGWLFVPHEISTYMLIFRKEFDQSELKSSQ